ncbi:MAG: VOC family protein [Coriobacteriia bacterium]|nr:VOC family protein [Coriobacteriia bacterium]
MQFRHVTLQVKDLKASLKFYEELVGLKITNQIDDGHGNQIVFLSSGGTEVELITSKNEPAPGATMSLGFVPESLEDTLAKAKEMGFEALGGIFSPNPATRFFFVKDPDGYRVQFMQTQI